MAKPKHSLDDDYATPCPHDASQRAGIVTNQPGEYDRKRSHCSVSVCPDPTCRARSMAYVHKVTGEPAVYVSDSTRMASRG